MGSVFGAARLQTFVLPMGVPFPSSESLNQSMITFEDGEDSPPDKNAAVDKNAGVSTASHHEPEQEPNDDDDGDDDGGDGDDGGSERSQGDEPKQNEEGVNTSTAAQSQPQQSQPQSAHPPLQQEVRPGTRVDRQPAFPYRAKDHPLCRSIIEFLASEPLARMTWRGGKAKTRLPMTLIAKLMRGEQDDRRVR